MRRNIKYYLNGLKINLIDFVKVSFHLIHKLNSIRMEILSTFVVQNAGHQLLINLIKKQKKCSLVIDHLFSITIH